MTIEQLIAQWNTSAEAAQQSPSPAQTEDSAVQVRTGLSAGLSATIGNEDSCTWSMSPTLGCYN